MEEVLTRRFRNYLRERDEGAHAGQAVRVPAEPAAHRRRQGPAQRRGARARGARPRRHLRGVSLAKRFEEVYLPGRPEPVRIPRDSEALYLLQQVRDEAHRFAITYHRQLRDKKMTTSVLDDVAGLGPDPQAAAAQAVRLGEEAAGARRGRARCAAVAARSRRRGPCTHGCTASTREHGAE